MWSWEEVSRQDLICPAVCVPCVPGREYCSTLWIACLGLPGEASIFPAAHRRDLRFGNGKKRSVCCCWGGGSV